MTAAEAAPRTARPSLPRLALGILLFGGVAVVALVEWLGLANSPLAETAVNVLYDAVIAAAAVACLVRAGEARSERAAWLTIAAAVFAWTGAEIYWTVAIEGNPDAPYPSPADVGYLAFYPLAAAGLALLVRARARQLDWRLWVDGAIAALGTAALGSAIVFQLVVDRTEGAGLELATTLAYPLADIAMLALVVGIVALTRWRPGPTWALLLLGIAAMAFADIAYTLQTSGVGVLPGDWVEPFYLFAAAFVGAAAWQRDSAAIRPEARFDGWRELIVPSFFAVVMIGLFVLQHFEQNGGLTSVLWAATMLAVLARLAISVRENKHLLEQVRTDALTGLANQGSMQVDLAERCARAREEPLTLVLFDLNGFKHYNDTHGHPAGDRMLRTVSDRLREAVAAAGGSAYRVGGDEFGVLLAGGAGDGEATIERAAAALAERGPGFRIDASWGMAAIPAEADTAAAAMELADVRMYAQKESRRVAEPAPAERGPDQVRVRLDDELEGAGSGEALEQGQ